MMLYHDIRIATYIIVYGSLGTVYVVPPLRSSANLSVVPLLRFRIVCKV
jgi:hypothetical protein